MGAFWWVLGGLTVLVGAMVLRDKPTRRKVIRAMARSWERRQRRSTGRAKTRARQHIRTAKRSAKSLPQAKPVYHRPRKPKLLATKCSAACRTSRKPAFDKNGVLQCDCPCGGREHGMYRKGSTTQTRAATKTAVGTSGMKKVSTPKPAAPARSSTPQRAAPNEKPKPPASPKWAAPSLATYERMKSHAEQSKRCKSGTFSTRTFRDRRTDPPKLTQTVACATCGKEL